MTPARLHAAALAGSADDTEAAFYDAMQHGDIDAMMACWADEDDIVCVHPGGGRLVGAAMIRAAYEALFGHGVVRAMPRRVRKVESLTAAVHSVIERVEVQTDAGLRAAYVTVTNVYHKTPQGWRMVVHHASTDSVGHGDDPESAGGPQTLH
ncbi:nuclear transport factor 2 family protein [Pseudorhodoferax sp. Leaf267]|uniref:YybH family protein n=1 Tax=Pseudorhodoferax sp. Leaf267 TaxID=1736316 RepID=UPI0006F69CE7|nr:nuclear transport factor 2 family protein [Pseudorhodoferax sp. Leaf267]KQP21672.1 ketosteroid isomerase [Pseudorhodoferax sp. Leaf267]